MVYNYCLSTKPDKNFVTVEGTVTAIFPERINARNRRSVCLLLQQTDRVSSTVLVTALSSNVDALHVDTLTIGTHIRISGYISYHGRGLHVLYMRTLDKEENANAGQIPEPEHCV